MPISLPAAFSRNAVAPTTSPNRVQQFITGRPQMIALVQLFSRISRTASNVDNTWKVLTVFCLTGLVLSLLRGSNGANLIPEFVGP
jgi:hypothetical protein